MGHIASYTVLSWYSLMLSPYGLLAHKLIEHESASDDAFLEVAQKASLATANEPWSAKTLRRLRRVFKNPDKVPEGEDEKDEDEHRAPWRAKTVHTEHGSKMVGGWTNQKRMQKLIDDKFGAAYDKDSRPVPDYSMYDGTSRIRIFTAVEFRHLDNLDHVRGQMTMTAWFSILWPDYRLLYSGKEYFGASPMGNHKPWNSSENYIPLKAHQVWIPHITVLNSVKPPEWINDASEVLWFDEDVYYKHGYNMVVTWPVVFHSSCPVRMYMFPFDKHLCTVEVGHWMQAWSGESQYEVEEAPRIHSELDKLNEDSKGSEFEFTNITIVRDANHYVSVKYELWLKRKPHYYLLKFVLPQWLLVLFSMAQHWLPRNEGRISFGITIVLSVMTVSFLTNGMVPNSPDVMWLERFQVGCYVLTCVPVFVAILYIFAQKHVIFGAVSRDQIRAEGVVCYGKGKDVPEYLYRLADCDKWIRVAHPVSVLLFHIWMFHPCWGAADKAICGGYWPSDQIDMMFFLITNMVIYLIFLVLGIAHFVGLIERGRDKKKPNDDATAVASGSDQEGDAIADLVTRSRSMSKEFP